jgi:hypothetical protein
MFKPAMVAVIGLVCVAAVVTQTGGPGFPGANGDVQVSGAALFEVPTVTSSPREERSYAQAPATHAAYGWRYPYALLWEPSLPGHRPWTQPAIGGGGVW